MGKATRMISMRTMAAMAAAVLLALAATNPALAHGSTKPKHGGQTVVAAGETVVELVRDPAGLQVYFTDHDEPITGAELQAKAIILENGAKREAALTPRADNAFVAAGVTVGTGAKVAVSFEFKATQTKGVAAFDVK